MFKKLSVAVLALIISGCAAKPHIGSEVTQTEKNGLTTTQTSDRSILPGGGLAGEESELREITANVKSVDLKNRTITLNNKEGRVVSFKVGKEIKNLPQVKSGDQVKVTFFESVAFEVRQPTAEELALSGTQTDVFARAPLGSKPGAVAANGRIGVLTIDSIDKKKELITLRGSSGVMTVKAKYPENLALLKQGDTVVVTTSELLAASVEEVG